MFETAMLGNGRESKRVWTTGLGFVGQTMLIGGMLAAPLIWPKALPVVTWVTSLAPPTSERPTPPVAETRVAPHTQVRPRLQWRDITAPPQVPDHVLAINDVENLQPVGPYVPGAKSSGPAIASDVLDTIIGTGARPKPPEHAPVAVTKPTDPPKPPRVTQMQMAEPIQRVSPVYPEMAKRTRISGKVELMGVLGTDGRIHEIKVLSGHPFLVKAAVDAVMQWVYRPTILNGQAVEVQAPITVNFILN